MPDQGVGRPGGLFLRGFEEQHHRGNDVVVVVVCGSLPGEDQRLRCGLLHSGLQPSELNGSLPIAVRHDAEQFCVPQTLSGLLNHGPRDVDQAGQEIEILQVPEEPDGSGACGGEPVDVETFRLVIPQLTEPLQHRSEGLLVYVALRGEDLADEVDIGFVAVSL